MTETSDILTSLLQRIVQGVVMFDSSRRLVVWNDQYEQLLDFPEGFLKVGVLNWEMTFFLAKRGDFGAGDPKKIADRRHELFWGQPASPSELTVRGDKTYDMLFQRTDDGGLVITYTDITERKRAETALRASEALFRDFAQTAADWMWETDADHRFVALSEGFQEKTGAMPTEFIGIERVEVVARTDARLAEAHLADLEAHRKFKDLCYWAEHSDGRKMYVNVSGKPLFDPDGVFTGYRGTGRDITEPKLSEVALHESEQRLTDIAKSAVDWFWETDENHCVTYVSPNVAEHTGIRPEDIVGKTRWHFIDPVIATNKPWQNHKADLDARKSFRDFEYDVVTGGQKYLLSTSGKPFYDGAGQFRGYRGAVRDISKIKALEEALRLTQRMEAIGQLTGGIAHDFNNLLAVIISNAETLELMNPGAGDAKSRIEGIIQAVDRGASLTHRLLAFSRKKPLSPIVTKMAELIDSLEDMFRRTLGETIELRIESVPDLWLSMIDPHQFEDALLNLAINARDAMPNGGTLSIEAANISLDQAFTSQHEELTPGDYVVVTVHDSGVGMANEVVQRAFEPFFTTKEMGGGSGLGLSMVYGFARQSRGLVTIDSEVSLGTTLKLYLPRSQDIAAEEETKREISKPEYGSERILVVEDNDMVRDGPVIFLRAQGYEIVEAVNGKEAIDNLKKGLPFDLLFTDVVLPGGLSGIEIAEEAVRIQPDIKILFTTGYAESVVDRNGKLDVSTNLVKKPYRRMELLEKVRAILDNGVE